MNNHEELIARVHGWHEENEHQKIINALESVPEDERTYDVICLLARAYSNVGQPTDKGQQANYEKATELLKSVETDGLTDPLWYMRMGYALFYLDRPAEALTYLNQCLALDSSNDLALELKATAEKNVERVTMVKPMSLERLAAYFDTHKWTYELTKDNRLNSGFGSNNGFIFRSHMADDVDWALWGTWKPDIPIEKRRAVLDACNEWNNSTRRPKTYIQIQDNGDLWASGETYVYVGAGITDQHLELNLRLFLMTMMDFTKFLTDRFPELVAEKRSE
ncbi:MAG: YbjN domain-containing protein [Actinomycetaceae bacterium]|nr:YbjN domain-containing protein [Actinomycetaceae bacterium]